MLTPAGMVWELAGSPDPGPVVGEGQCAICGRHGTVHGKIPQHFTDFRILVAPGVNQCGPCTWALSGKPPATLRMWSLVARTDIPAPASQPAAHAHGEHLHATNRRDMTWIASTLADPPSDGSGWLVTVAESGQKHTLPFARINHDHRRWTVRMDGVDVTSTPDQWRHALSRSAVLRAAGFTAAEIEAGVPSMNRLKGELLTVWREHAPHLAAYAGTPLLHLTNLMITKESCEYYTRTYPV